MTNHDDGQRTLWLMTLVRLVGIALAMGGLWLAARLPFGPESRWLALLPLVGGTALVVLAPRFFRRRGG